MLQFSEAPRRALIITVLSFVAGLLVFANIPRKAPVFLSGLQISRLRNTADILDVFNSTLGFERVLVVNLPSRTDRKDGMVLAAAVSNIDVEFIDGVDGVSVPDKALPPGLGRYAMSNATIGSWRAHMNAIQSIVHRNLSSALILEDDVDWDIRLRSQLHDFALSARALTQPLLDQPQSYADPTYHSPQTERISADLDFAALPLTVQPRFSPYGEDWDILWLGHCGMKFQDPANTVSKCPTGRIIQQNDPTVAETANLTNYHQPNPLLKYPNHTRVTSHVADGVCTLGYALTQAGARRLLYHVGLMELEVPFDIAVRQFCEGAAGRTAHTCLTTLPPLFEHHRPRGLIDKESDISNHGDRYVEKAHTDVIRWSTRLNWELLLQPPWKGKKVWVDSYPDTG